MRRCSGGGVTVAGVFLAGGWEAANWEHGTAAEYPPTIALRGEGLWARTTGIFPWDMHWRKRQLQGWQPEDTLPKCRKTKELMQMHFAAMTFER